MFKEKYYIKARNWFDKAKKTEDPWFQFVLLYISYEIMWKILKLKKYELNNNDWIAEKALDLSIVRYGFDWIDSNQRSFWTERRRKIYLWATYGPDVSNGVVWESRSGQTVSSKGDVAYHIARFDPASGALVRCPSGGTANKYALEAVRAIKDGDCDLAAVLMGWISHYISDLSCFPHVWEGWFMDPDHAKFESKISERTDSCLGVGRPSAEAPYNDAYMYECFRVYASPLFVVCDETPEELAIKLAYDTHFNPPLEDPYGEGIYTAEWMVDNFDRITWTDGGSRHDTIADQHAVWTEWGLHKNDELKLVWYHFMKRVEESLNLAIQHVASALSWIIDEVDVYQCKGGNSVESANNSLVKHLVLYSLMSLAYWAGLVASMYALQVTAFSKIKL